jgi:hypothetical protein
MNFIAEQAFQYVFKRFYVASRNFVHIFIQSFLVTQREKKSQN